MSDTATTAERVAPRFTRRSIKGAHKIGPHSRPHTLAKVDGRTREAEVLRRTRAELTVHVGGAPNVVQKALIERAAWLSLKISLLDRKIASGKDLTQIDTNVYLAWVGSLARLLTRLGIEPKREGTKPSLESIIAKAASP
jgi:hypothetical protein